MSDAALWLGHQVALCRAWFDHRPGWLQLVMVLALIAAIVALTHCDELRRAREWSEFKAWQERRQRAAKLKGVR